MKFVVAVPDTLDIRVYWKCEIEATFCSEKNWHINLLTLIKLV